MKIFLTVGSMLPFDRLVKALDNWAKYHKEHSIFAQIGETSYRPKNFEYQQMITPSSFRKRCNECDLIISHVGMGTVLAAFEYNKPLIALPRRPELKEVTSNHQVASAKWLRNRPGIIIMENLTELDSQISGFNALMGKNIKSNPARHVSLTISVRNFIVEELND